MRRRALGLLLALLAGPAFAWQWPVEVPVITRTFGQDAGGYLLRGVEFGGGAQPVSPIEAGVVVVSRSEPEAGRRGVPSGLGSYLVIEHAQGFRSVYAHLEAGSLPPVGREVDVETTIGTVGESGLIDRRALRLMIIDLESGEYVNPMLLLPDLEDRFRPIVTAVFARSPEALIDLAGTRTLPPGRYEITAVVSDRRGPTAVPALAPFRIAMFVAGQERFSLTMDRIAVDPETTLVPGGLGHGELYGAGGELRLGTVEISGGRTELEIVAADFVGNEASWRAELTGQINEDVQ